LLGPNGAGKTTLFKILSTLIEPDAGSARIGGYDLRDEPDEVRAVLSPVIADERSLNWRLSATENLRFYASLYGLSGDVHRKRVGELLEVVGLEDTGRKIVGAFSSGMKQRLLLARALLGFPKVLLLDEPTRSLDPVAARRFREFLRDEIVGRQGCTVLLATHNSEEALDLCDRVGVLDKGRMITLGQPRELNRKAVGCRYRLWTPMPEHPIFRTNGISEAVTNVMEDGGEDRLSMIDLSFSDDADRPALFLEMLVREGVRVHRYERVQLPLADLIESLVRSNGTGHSS
jgi:ABC-2 type transport system ATP-binding protein